MKKSNYKFLISLLLKKLNKVIYFSLFASLLMISFQSIAQEKYCVKNELVNNTNICLPFFNELSECTENKEIFASWRNTNPEDRNMKLLGLYIDNNTLNRVNISEIMSYESYLKVYVSRRFINKKIDLKALNMIKSIMKEVSQENLMKAIDYKSIDEIIDEDIFDNSEMLVLDFIESEKHFSIYSLMSIDNINTWASQTFILIGDVIITFDYYELTKKCSNLFEFRQKTGDIIQKMIKNNNYK